jgi:hypothetical protein
VKYSVTGLKCNDIYLSFASPTKKKGKNVEGKAGPVAGREGP